MRVESSLAAESVASLARPYGMPAEELDGNDVDVVLAAAGEAVERARRGEGPSLLECRTYRVKGHNVGDAEAYRTREEVAGWAPRDPLRIARERYLAAGVLTEEVEARLEAEVEEASRRWCGSWRRAAEPEDAVALEDVYARELRYREALNEALREELARDETVFLIGEDIADPYGGNFKVTLGLSTDFGEERVRNAPDSEGVICGMAVGAAMCGWRPVAEVMYVDFSTLGMDYIVNHAAKLRYMTGGQVGVPAVFRMQGGAGRASGAQHTQSLEAWFAHIPGLYVAMPATATTRRGC